MNVVLTFVPELISKYEFKVLDNPPLALYVLAATLRKTIHQVTIVDPCEFLVFNGKENIEEQCMELLVSKGALETDLIAFSSNTFNWGITKNIIERVKHKKEKLMIAAGGLHPSIFDQHVIQNSCSDFVLRGEGEKTLSLLLDTLQNKGDLSMVENLTYRTKNEIVRNPDSDVLDVGFLENTPMPEYQYIPQPNPYTAYPVESSRGCAYSCAFCSIQHRHNWRGFSVDNVLERVDHLYNALGDSCKDKLFLFVDDCFTINAQRAIDILRGLYEKYRYDLKYFIEVRISNILNQNLLSRLPVDLISSMQIGVECGYDEGLKKINKEITIKQLIQALNLIKINGYASKSFLSFIIGFPWETEREINLTLNTVQHIASAYHVTCNVNWMFLLPSDLWEIRKQYNIDVDETIFDDPFWLNSRNLFEQVHPLINESAVKRIENRIQEMSRNGLPVAYNSAPTLKK